jgi:outer membrane lipoprotein-sorting protein
MRCFRGWACVVALCMALQCAAVVRADDDAGRALLKQVIDAVPKVPLIAKMDLKSKNGLEREMTLERKPTQDGDATYLEVTAPDNLKDTRFLFFERGPAGTSQYMYVPFMKRTIQIRDEARKQPFLGSEFYVSDLILPDLDAFKYTVVGHETVNGRACTLVQSEPKSPEPDDMYSRLVLAIDPKDSLILRTQFYDPKGKLLKVWTIDKVEKIDGYWTPVQQTVKNVQEDTESELTLTSVKYNADVPDSVFSKPHLER